MGPPKRESDVDRTHIAPIAPPSAVSIDLEEGRCDLGAEVGARAVYQGRPPENQILAAVRRGAMNSSVVEPPPLPDLRREEPERDGGSLPIGRSEA